MAAVRLTRPFGFLAALVLVLSGTALSAWAQAAEETAGASSSIWYDAMGGGFKRGATRAGFAMGAGFGTAAFGSVVAHDLALGSVSVGRVLTDPLAPGKWYGGNLEFVGELAGGAQFRPEARYLVGLTPLLRYCFSTGTRWVPFITAGAGVALTDIGRPDLSGTFQFDPQGGIGTYCFLRSNTALTLEYRWMHVSNAGILQPNDGVNTQMFSAGISWFF